MSDRTCAVPGCDRKHICRGWCHMHYMRWRATGDPEKVKKAARADWGATCTFEGCRKPSKSRSLCNLHYRRVLKSGDPAVTKLIRDPDRPCQVADCTRPHIAKGWCRMHWQRVQLTGDPGGVEPRWRFWPEGCSIPGCDRPHGSRGYCASHFQIYIRARRLREATDEVVRPEVVFERDGWMCGICSGDVDAELRHPDPMSRSLDHIIPLARGGRHAYHNVQLAHWICNIRKSDKLDYIA